MERRRRSSRARIAALLAAFGLVVAAVVTAVAGSGSAAHCGRDPACVELVETLSMRMGLLVGGTAVLMLLVVAGLLRMVRQDEARREQAASARWE